MVKTLTIFSLRPNADPKVARKHWGESHMPWIRKLPGLEKYVINWVVEPIRGEDVYGMAELWYKDMETARTTMRNLVTSTPDPFAKLLYHVTVVIVEETEIPVEPAS
jgi:uncharacterized protein (TIGR02118 family)